MAVVIERTDSEYVIKLPLSIDPVAVQKMLEYFEFLDVVSRSQATEEDITSLASEVKSGWSEDIKNRLKELDEFKDTLG